MHALIMSDLHLGARNSQHQLILQRLACHATRHYTHIILNGDVVDHLNFESFRPADWAVIHRLKQLVHESRLIVVQGNHDRPRRAEPGCISHSILGDMLGTELQEELTLNIGGERYLVQHGDRYDQTLNMSRLGYLAEGFYRQAQRWHQPTSRWLKRQSKSILGIEHNVRMKAIASATHRGFAGIILGHTHYASNEVDQQGIRYVNTGSWVDDACTYLDVKDSRVIVKEWLGEEVLVEPVSYPADEMAPVFEEYGLVC